jgi:cytochrome c553
MNHGYKWIFGSLFCLMSTLVVATEIKGVVARGAEIHEDRCFVCHGVNADSSSPILPRLAGQTAEYIVLQLKNFKSGNRNSYAMRPQVGDLTPEDIANLAVFYQQRRPKAFVSEKPELVKQGAELYVTGKPAVGVPACSACHGEKAMGNAEIPRLASQFPSYIEFQLKEFDKRRNTPESEAMRMFAKSLSESDIKALAEYLGSLE